MKHPIKSKTISFAMLLALFGALEVAVPTLQPLLGKWYGVIYVLVAVIVAYLRFVTTEPIKNVNKD